MTKLNILYIHGFGSQVDPNGDKQVALRKIANVSAFAPDYSQGYEKVLADVEPLLQQADLLIGTSMGGFLVSRLSEATGKPFVAINPVMAPSAILSKYIGSHLDHYGRPFTLTADTASGYPDFLPSARGMVLLDMADELLDSRATLDALGPQMTAHTFTGGSHRFSHMEEALWDSVIAEEAEIDVTAPQREELDRRLSAFEIDQNVGSTWSTVKARILSK